MTAAAIARLLVSDGDGDVARCGVGLNATGRRIQRFTRNSKQIESAFLLAEISPKVGFQNLTISSTSADLISKAAEDLSAGKPCEALVGMGEINRVGNSSEIAVGRAG